MSVEDYNYRMQGIEILAQKQTNKKLQALSVTLNILLPVLRIMELIG